MSLEKQIKRAWRYYKVRSGDCHTIAQRVEKRRVLGTPFAYPEEIKEYDKKARELKEVETYIAVRQKELNRYNKRYKEDMKFNTEQLVRLKDELIKY